MSALLFVFESMGEYALHSAGYDFPLFRTQEFHSRSPTTKGPKPEVNPFGPHYRMHPELSRAGGPGVYYGLGAATFVGVPVTIAAANFAVIEAAPEEQRSGLYQMFSSALTGTFGGGFSGIV